MLTVLVALILALTMIVLLRPWPFFYERNESPASNEKNIAAEFGKWVEYRAKAHGLNARGVARSVPLECRRCGKSSNYFVYPDELCERCWHNSLKQISTSTPAEQTGQ